MKIIRYPGGKHRILRYILPYLPPRDGIRGKFVEPFVGSGAVFLAMNPKRAILGDISEDLIDLYRGIRRHPEEVWGIFSSFPSNRKSYYAIRDGSASRASLTFKAARTLYLNRTCFKGMWRYNLDGKFNVGYGGQDRRWVISKKNLMEVSSRLKKASLKCSDFQRVIDECVEGDFIFLDPPYVPGECEMVHAHYMHGTFDFQDYERLARVLRKATKRGVRWAMTISSHPDISQLFRGNLIIPIARGTGKSPGMLTDNSGEVLTCNFVEIN